MVSKRESLRLKLAEEGPPSVTTPHPKTQDKGTVLLVDDEQRIIDVAKPRLEGAGYKVMAYLSMEEAIAALSVETAVNEQIGDQIVCAVLDIRLGTEGLGDQLYAKCKDEGWFIPTGFYSGFPEEINRIDAPAVDPMFAIAKKGADSLAQLVKAVDSTVQKMHPFRALYHETRQASRAKVAASTESSVVRGLQHFLLPSEPLTLDNYTVIGRSLPMEGTPGGDVWNYRALGTEGDLALLIGENPAHQGTVNPLLGFVAGDFTRYVMSRSGFTMPSAYFTSLHQSIGDIPGQFLSGIYGVLDATNNIFVYVSADGQTPIKITESGVAIVEEPAGVIGPRLGFGSVPEYKSHTIPLAEGESLILMSDGLKSATYLRNGTVKPIPQHLMESLDSQKPNGPEAIAGTLQGLAQLTYRLGDDLTFVVVGRH